MSWIHESPKPRPIERINPSPFPTYEGEDTVVAIRGLLRRYLIAPWKDTLKVANGGDFFGYRPSDVTSLHELQQREDVAFAEQLPQEYAWTANQVASVEQRWIETQRAVGKIADILKQNRVGDEVYMVYRAKGLLSIWEKMKRDGVSARQVYDQRGIRIITTDEDPETQIQHALRIKHAILHSDKFRLMDPEEFPPRPEYKGRVQVMDPLIDRLLVAGRSGYRRVRMNMREVLEPSSEGHEEVLGPVVEIQLTTLANVKELNQDNKLLPAWKAAGVTEAA